MCDGVCVVRDLEAATQLASIEASSLRAPEGLHDDRADVFAQAMAALAWRGTAVVSTVGEAAVRSGGGMLSGNETEPENYTKEKCLHYTCPCSLLR